LDPEVVVPVQVDIDMVGGSHGVGGRGRTETQLARIWGSGVGAELTPAAGWRTGEGYMLLLGWYVAG